MKENEIITRVDYIDLFRAFGVILMIMGHIGYGGIFDKWIHAFHMPMFYFVSGWFFKHQKNVSIKRMIGKKARNLLLPYFAFEILLWCICLIFITEYRNLNTLSHILFVNNYKIIIETGTFGISPIPGAMWFLTSLFLTECFYIIFDKWGGYFVEK